MKESFMILAGIVCLIAFLSLVSQEIKKAKAIAEKEENQTKKYVYDHVLDLAETVVMSLNQTLVDPLKESETLTFDEEAQKRALNKAKKKVKKILDDKSKELLEDYLGSQEDLDDYIEDSVERKVKEVKKDK